MFKQVAGLRISLKLLWSLYNGTQYANVKCWKITGIHFTLKICLLGQTTKQPLSPENLENTSNSKSWGLTLVAYKKSVIKLFERFHAESVVLCCSNAFDPSQISRYTANEIEISLNDFVQIKSFNFSC